MVQNNLVGKKDHLENLWNHKDLDWALKSAFPLDSVVRLGTVINLNPELCRLD